MSDLETCLQEICSTYQVDLRTKTTNFARSHDVYILEFVDDTKRVLRVPKSEFAAALSNHGLLFLRHLKALRPYLQIPNVLLHTQQYTLLEYLQGEPIDIWNTQRFDEATRKTLLSSLAVALFEIWTCPIPTDAQDNSSSYEDWLFEEVDKGICRSLKDSLGWGGLIHFLSRRARVSQLVPEYEVHTCAIKHGDLNACNVIYNDDRISGIIDWDTAQVCPRPAIVQHPLFIADIPGWRNGGVTHDMTFEKDRYHLETEVAKLARASPLADAYAIPRLLASSSARQFFELSLRNRRVNEAYILQHQVSDDKTLLKQLESFNSRHESLIDHPTIVELHEKLKGSVNSKSFD